jgi:hypothetical protein
VKGSTVVVIGVGRRGVGCDNGARWRLSAQPESEVEGIWRRIRRARSASTRIYLVDL